MAYMSYVPYKAMAYGAYQATRSRPTPRTYARTLNSLTIRNRPRKRKTGTYSSFKTKMLSNTPAKHQITNDNQTQVVGATHNTIYTCNLTAGIIAGTADDERIGDSVQLISLKVNALLSSNASLTSSCQYRIIIGYSGEEYNLPNTFSNTGLGITEIFQANSGTSWRNTGIINPKAFTVLDDRIYTLNNSITNVADIQEFAYSIPVNTTFPFQASGSVYGKTRNLYIVFIPCILNGASGVTNAGNIALSTDLIFKQL